MVKEYVSPMKVCPRCKLGYTWNSALCRRDNVTQICSNCGTTEAMEDAYNAPYEGEPYWKVQQKSVE